MAEKLQERLRHALIAALLSVGLVMPLLGVLDSCLISLRVLPMIAGMILLFEAASLHRFTAFAAACTAAVCVAAWVFLGNGARILSDTGLALSLRMNGIETAVPLVSDAVTILITVVLTLLSCFASLKQVTCIPALMLCLAVSLTVWLTDQMQMIPWLLPALAAGLALLMISRFEEMQPIQVLPWAAALVAAAFLLTGNGAVLQPLKDKADEIRQAILDRLFFTEARDVFSLYSEGYSPQGPDQLGGKPNPSEHPVMQVSTPKVTYLRGTVYDNYDGHGWKNTTGGRRYLWQMRRTEDLRISLFNQALPSESIQNSLSNPAAVSVRMLSDSASTLFVPQRVRQLIPGGETVPYFSNSSEIFITRNLQAGDTYEVRAPLYTSLDPGIGSLTEICGSLEDPGWQNAVNMYTQIPSHLEQPVWELARDVTSVAGTPFEKALAMQNYLSRNYRYTLDVGEHPENIDFITSFLLDTKKGYCTYFASAMTVLCRMAGLPARYVEGYLAEPNKNGEALVTGLSAHAWTEVYFKGFGWLTFDATPVQHSSSGESPSSSGGGNTPPSAENEKPEETEEPSGTESTPEPPEEKPEPSEDPDSEPENEPPEGNTEPEDSPDPEDSPEPEDSPDPETPPEPDHPPDSPENGDGDAEGKRHASASFPWWWILVAAVAAAIGLRCVITSPVFMERRADTEEKRFDIWTREIFLLLQAEGLVRKKGETPMAFARRVDLTGIFSESISPSGECLSLIRYSRAKPLETDTGLMRDTALLLHGEISGKAKMKYWLTRIFRKTK